MMHSSSTSTGTAESGVRAERADSSDGKVAVTGVVNSSLGLTVGMVAVEAKRAGLW